MPHIILMDCQMPVLDGYQTTHLIRHHKPYSAIAGIRTLPIVAMTASAIQGDKEKCKSAGMDDYLAKPVKSKLLEEMLVKWAIEGKDECRLSATFSRSHTDNDSICEVPCSTLSSGPSAESSGHGQPLHHQQAPKGFRVDKLVLNARQKTDEVEDQARYLRDDKLLAASEPESREIRTALPRKSPTFRGPATPLTFENVSLLDREVVINPFDSLFANKTEAGSSSRRASRVRDTFDGHGIHDMEYCDGESASGSPNSGQNDSTPVAAVKEKEIDPIRHAMRAARLEKNESQNNFTQHDIT